MQWGFFLHCSCCPGRFEVAAINRQSAKYSSKKPKEKLGFGIPESTTRSTVPMQYFFSSYLFLFGSFSPTAENSLNSITKIKPQHNILLKNKYCFLFLLLSRFFSYDLMMNACTQQLCRVMAAQLLLLPTFVGRGRFCCCSSCFILSSAADSQLKKKNQKKRAAAVNIGILKIPMAGPM